MTCRAGLGLIIAAKFKRVTMTIDAFYTSSVALGRSNPAAPVLC